MAGLVILEHMHDLSDENLGDRWLENPYYQYFCGAEFFCHKLLFDRSSPTRWRQRVGEERLVAMRNFREQRFALRCPTARAGHVRLGRGLIQKNSRSGANLPWYFFQNRRLRAAAGRSC